MVTRRNLGIACIALGFVMTAVAGFLLALSNLTPGDLALRALLVFVLVLPIFGFGIYQYVTSNPEPLGTSETEQQLMLIDIIRERGQVSLQDLARELHVNIGTITRLVEDLDSLDLFTGYVDWANSRVYAVRPHELPDNRLS